MLLCLGIRLLRNPHLIRRLRRHLLPLEKVDNAPMLRHVVGTGGASPSPTKVRSSVRAKNERGFQRGKRVQNFAFAKFKRLSPWCNSLVTFLGQARKVRKTYLDKIQ